MQQLDPNFRERVEMLVAQIPKGRVMTYGQLAALCGNARAARIVGGIAHFGDPDLPWQRVVNKQGGLASGYPGDRQGHKAALEAEGYMVSDDFQVDVAKLIWWPREAHWTSTVDAREQSVSKSKKSHLTDESGEGPAQQGLF